MADDIRVTSMPGDDSKYRVALDLARFVIEAEGYANFKTRKAVLDLYVQCRLAVVNGRSV